MADVIAWLTSRPAVAHLMRAAQRFGLRLGSQFAAAMAYFSVLSLIPIAMFGLTIAGYVLEIRPELVPAVRESMRVGLGLAPGDTATSLDTALNSFLDNYRTVGVVALCLALFTGAGWVGNLKRAVQAQSRPRFDTEDPPPHPLLDIVTNIGLLVVLLLLVGITVTLTAATTSLNDWVLGLLRLPDSRLVTVSSRIISVAATVFFSFVLFAFIYRVLPNQKPPRAAWLRGSLVAALGLLGLQYGATFLFSLFDNETAKVLGPIIVLLVVLNLFATLILFIAAWIATADQPAAPETLTPAVDLDAPVLGPVVPPRLLSGRRFAARAVAKPVDGKIAWTPGAGQPYVSQEVAKKSVQVGIGAGWVTGIATGLGIGAGITSAIAGLARRRRQR